MTIDDIHPGTRLRLKNSYPPHGTAGDILEVTQVKLGMIYTKDCGCKQEPATVPERYAHSTREGYKWSFSEYDFDIVEQITDEEKAKAVSLPSPDDVASFFGLGG